MNNIIDKNQYFLGVDGGGTKTIARLENLQTGQQWQAIGGPASLTNDFNAALHQCEVLIERLCVQANCLRADITLVLGLAGAGNKEKAFEFQQHLLAKHKNVNVFTDAKTSLYGANAGEPIVVIAIGTGSVGAALTQDGKEIQKGGWGFNVGDEGSGAKMGVLAIKAVLSEIDDFGEVDSLLAHNIVKILNVDATGVLAWSTTAKPAEFALLAPLIFEYHETCDVAKKILVKHIGHVENLIKKTRSLMQVPVVLLGGLSVSTIPFLNPEIKKTLVKAKGNALDGACLLAKKLTQNKIIRRSTNGN
jgi:glucosamine kinase